MKVSLLRSLPILLSAFLMGCKDNLTEEKAEALIREKISFPITNTVTIDYGLVGYRFDSLPRYYYALEHKGMFTIDHLGEGGFLARSYRFRITPTVEGKKYLVEQNGAPVAQGNTGEFKYSANFKTGETEFGKVLSIHEAPSLNVAQVRYEIKLVNNTPFWSYYSDKKKPDSVASRNFEAVKTNNGWEPHTRK